MEQKQNKRTGKLIIALALMLLLMMVIMPAVKAALEVSLASQIDPMEFGETQTLLFNITSNATLTLAKIEFNSQNHTLQKQGVYHEYVWIPKIKGVNTYTVYAANALNEQRVYSDSFTVQDTVPPSIMQTAPQGTLDYALIELSATTDENSTCKYDGSDISYDSMAYTLSGTGRVHSKLRSFTDGNKMFYVRCKDPDENIGLSGIISFTIDTSPPKITSLKPQGTVTNPQETLRFSTDEIATCRWSSSNNQYSDMPNQFTITGATRHEHSITLTEGINTYYIACEDEVGNYDDPLILNAELNKAPSAGINVEKNEGYSSLTHGTYDVTLDASENLHSTPSLKLSYGKNAILVPLEGDGDYWTGYLIIPENLGERVAEFIFSGTDMKGTQGTEVTRGKLVIIDTLEPEKPIHLKLANKNNMIKLTWDYVGEEIDHFNIYRSTTGKTGKNDLKASATETVYYDSGIKNKIGYFYKISAVDKAGNEGPLSDEEFIMTDFTNLTGFEQDPEIVALLDLNTRNIQQLIDKADFQIAELETKNDDELILLINNQGLVDTQKEIKTELRSLIGELRTYYERDVLKSEVESKINIINAKVNQLKTGLIKDVYVRNKAQYEQVVDESTIQGAVNEYLKAETLSDDQRKKYLSKIKSLQEEIRVTQEFLQFEIGYEYKDSEKISYVKESVLSPKALADVIVQEVVPKDVVKISEISFDITPEDLNGLGPLWSIENLDDSVLSYKLLVEKDLNILREIRTVVLYEVNSFLGIISAEGNQESEAGITGNAVSESSFSLKNFLSKYVLIIFGALVIVALSVYYFSFLKAEQKYGGHTENRQNEVLITSGQSGEVLVESKPSEIFGSKKDFAYVMSLVRLADAEADRSNYAEAHRLYTEALSYYSRINLGFISRLKLNYLMNSLHEKLK